MKPLTSARTLLIYYLAPLYRTSGLLDKDIRAAVIGHPLIDTWTPPN